MNREEVLEIIARAKTAGSVPNLRDADLRGANLHGANLMRLVWIAACDVAEDPDIYREGWSSASGSPSRTVTW